MRRLPIYFLIDVSESMVGEPIKEVEDGIRNIIQELRMDPYALETVFVSIIAFAGKAKTLVPLTELYKFYPPTFHIGGGTSLGKGLDYLMSDLDKSINKTTFELKGDWKPIIFLFTDGNPTDNFQNAINRWNKFYRKGCNLVAISLGDNVNALNLAQITENVLILKNTDKESFTQFFKWISASIKTSSVSVTEQGDDNIKLPSTKGINLEKADLSKRHIVDENFAVVLAKCQTTNKPYLIKYERKSGETDEIKHLVSHGFRLVGAYPIDENSYKELSEESVVGKNINTQLLSGRPTCPCCGNQIGFVICECGGVFCAGENANDHCPWCGMQGELSVVENGGLDINRAIG